MAVNEGEGWKVQLTEVKFALAGANDPIIKNKGARRCVDLDQIAFWDVNSGNAHDSSIIFFVKLE